MTNFAFILERLSSRAKNALITAQLVSEELQHDHIGTEHLLYGVVAEKSSFASEILNRAKLNPELVKKEIAQINSSPKVPHWKPVLSENLKVAIEKSAIIASQYGYQFIGTEHFLYGILNNSNNRARQIFKKLNLDIYELEQNLLNVFENISRFPENNHEANFETANNNHPNHQNPSPQKTSALEYFTTDLTKKASQGLVDPVVGRKKEIDRLVSILNRRTKNNPVLIGEAGVGKTAIVEGLALAIAKREVPDNLLDKKILGLDLALVVAGSMFRGEFENRVKQIMDEVKEQPNVILFIDELHTMVGAGATTGSLDAANILKPALARGEIRTIGATTLAEYKKHIEHDAALERRFQPILVDEPSKDESYEILKGLRPNYEKHHNVKITDEALRAAVDLSTRYIQDHYLPDKAVDLVDETAAFLKTISSNSKILRAIKKIEHDLTSLEEEKSKSVLNQDFTTALHLKTQEDKLQRQKQELEIDLSKEQAETQRIITGEDIAHTVSMMTKIPLAKLSQNESIRLNSLERILKSKIVGQDEALTEISKAIRRSRAGLQDPNRPIGSFIFLGPTGVGKTETAKIIAKEIFQDEDALIRVDMSEFMERHNVSRLIGAPAGYVGYEEGGRLTEAVRRKPYSVILFDELEKANPDVFNILLQILEDGQLTDAQGKTVNFKNTIIIMTSNLGMQELNLSAAKIGFADKENKVSEKAKLEKDYENLKNGVMEIIKREFRPEFLNRINKVLIFKPLGITELRRITTIHLQELSQRLAEQKIHLKISPAVSKFIAEKSFDPSQGARFIRKNIQDLIEDPLAEKILSEPVIISSVITVDLDNQEIVIHKEKQKNRLPVTA